MSLLDEEPGGKITSEPGELTERSLAIVSDVEFKYSSKQLVQYGLLFLTEAAHLIMCTPTSFSFLFLLGC